MDKIPFVDGTKIKNATVTVNEQEYEVTPAQYQGTTPMSAFNLNKMQDNIENTLVKVSATEPSPKADVWIKHGKNLYKGQSLQNGLYAGVSNTIGSNSNGWYVIVPITGGATYTISKKYTNADNSNLQLFLCTTQDFPAKGVSMIDIWRGSASLANTTIETSENANYLFICLAAGSKSIITEEIQKMAVEELMVEVGAEKKDYEAPLEDDILVNDNGVYNSILQDIKDRLNALESQATQNTAENNI